MIKKSLFLTLIFLTSLVGFGQLDVKKNYSKPYFQGSVEVKDTLRVDNLFQLEDGALIKSENGSGILDLRNLNNDGDVFLGNINSSILFDKSNGTYINDGIIGVHDLASVSLVRNSQISFNLTAANFTRIGSFALVANQTSDYSILNFPNYCGYSSSQGGTIKQNVLNSWIVSGTGAIAKTNNTAYLNQIGFNTGLAGEMILEHTPNAGNFTATLKAETGTIALINDISSSSGNFIKNIISPGTLTSDVDNWNPTGYDDETDLIRIDIDNNNREITGIVAPSPGVNRILGVTNLNNLGDDIRFTNNDASSLAANRFLLRDSAQKSIKPNETAWFWYDHLSSRWRPFNRIG